MSNTTATANTTNDAATWAAAKLIDRADAAVDRAHNTHSGSERLAIHGRAVLLDEIPRTLSVRDYPVVTGDDWRGDADAAYEAARECWAAGGSDEEVLAAVGSSFAQLVSESQSEVL